MSSEIHFFVHPLQSNDTNESMNEKLKFHFFNNNSNVVRIGLVGNEIVMKTFAAGEQLIHKKQAAALHLLRYTYWVC